MKMDEAKKKAKGVSIFEGYLTRANEAHLERRK